MYPAVAEGQLAQTRVETSVQTWRQAAVTPSGRRTSWKTIRRGIGNPLSSSESFSM